MIHHERVFWQWWTQRWGRGANRPRWRPNVPPAECVAFIASLDQMFHLAGFTSNSAVETQRLSGVRSFNCRSSIIEDESMKQKGSSRKKAGFLSSPNL